MLEFTTYDTNMVIEVTAISRATRIVTSHDAP